jgi:hypothetical protein
MSRNIIIQLKEMVSEKVLWKVVFRLLCHDPSSLPNNFISPLYFLHGLWGTVVRPDFMSSTLCIFS